MYLPCRLLYRFTFRSHTGPGNGPLIGARSSHSLSKLVRIRLTEPPLANNALPRLRFPHRIDWTGDRKAQDSRGCTLCVSRLRTQDSSSTRRLANASDGSERSLCRCTSGAGVLLMLAWFPRSPERARDAALRVWLSCTSTCGQRRPTALVRFLCAPTRVLRSRTDHS